MKTKFSKSQLFNDPTLAPTTRLWLIRHAEVESNYQNKFGGRIDMDLSPQGHLQALALGKYLGNFVFDACYASPMKRVQQTLASMQLEGMPRPTVLEGLREIDFGDWTGLSFEEVFAQYNIHPFTWLDQIEAAGIRNGESSAVFGGRVRPCLEQILAEGHGKNIAIACHGGVIRMLLALILNLPLPRMNSFQIEYASITQVWWPGTHPELRLVNFTPWRDIRP